MSDDMRFNYDFKHGIIMEIKPEHRKRVMKSKTTSLDDFGVVKRLNNKYNFLSNIVATS
jgi:hypothetical protein